MALSLSELIELRIILEECKRLVHSENIINRLIESERTVIREIKLKTTNYVTGKAFPQYEGIEGQS